MDEYTEQVTLLYKMIDDITYQYFVDYLSQMNKTIKSKSKEDNDKFNEIYNKCLNNLSKYLPHDYLYKK